MSCEGGCGEGGRGRGDTNERTQEKGAHVRRRR